MQTDRARIYATNQLNSTEQPVTAVVINDYTHRIERTLSYSVGLH